MPNTIAEMARHALDFLNGLGVTTCDVLGFSLGGMVAQQMVLETTSIFRRMILVGTAPRGEPGNAFINASSNRLLSLTFLSVNCQRSRPERPTEAIA